MSTALHNADDDGVMVDIEKTELAEARRSLSTLLLPDCRIYTYIQKYDLVEIFPNVLAALRITLSMPVCFASGECSFSKLK